MKPRSLQRTIIVTTIAFEIASLFAFGFVATLHESRTRLHAFDQMLHGDAALLFGGVEDADDVGDNIMFETKELRFPQDRLFDVIDQKGHTLGRSKLPLPATALRSLPLATPDGIYAMKLNGERYRFIVMHAIRVIDPGMANGGSPRPVVIRYGAPIAGVWREIWKTVFFYCVASLLLICTSVFSLIPMLRKGLAPLHALADEASRLSSQQWTFHAPQQAANLRELAPLTQAIESTIARLQRSFEQQRRLTSDAAHELKTAIAIVKSSLQVTTLRERSPEQYRCAIEDSLDDVLRLEELVARMLLLARLNYAAAQPASQRDAVCNAASLLQRIAQQLGSYATLQHISIEISSPQASWVRIAEEDFAIVCTNLLLNALQHSLRGSIVEATLRESGQHIEMVIRDRGQGIAAADLSHLFEPFYRGEAARDRKSGGTGLGLSICKGLVEAAGGAISIDSKPGVGTEIRVLLQRSLHDA